MSSNVYSADFSAKAGGTGGGKEPPMETTIEALGNRVGEIEKDLTGLRQEVSAIRAEMKTEFVAVRGEMKTGFAEIRTEMHKNSADIIKWMIGLAVGLGLAGITIMTFLLNNVAAPKAAPLTAQQPAPYIIQLPAQPNPPPQSKNP